MPVLDIADDDVSTRKARRAGSEFQYDEAGNVTSARVPMMLRDAAARDADRREVQRQIREFQGQIADRQRVVDGAGDAEFRLQRPGSRALVDAAAYDASRAAYETMIRDSCEAWRRGPGSQDALAHGTEYSGQEGDSCTTRAGSAEGYLEGSPGHIARADGRLVCVPNEPASRRSDSMSASDAQAIKDKAYDEMVCESEQAWKNLGRHG